MTYHPQVGLQIGKQEDRGTFSGVERNDSILKVGCQGDRRREKLVQEVKRQMKEVWTTELPFPTELEAAMAVAEKVARGVAK